MNLARERGQVFDLLLTRYALERLLYRLSISQHRNRFVLKGAMLVTTWFDDPHRPTRDLDLLGFGEFSAESMLAVWKEICAIAADDGITFDGDGLRASPIREDMVRIAHFCSASDLTRWSPTREIGWASTRKSRSQSRYRRNPTSLWAKAAMNPAYQELCQSLNG